MATHPLLSLAPHKRDKSKWLHNPFLLRVPRARTPWIVLRIVLVGGILAEQDAWYATVPSKPG